MPTQKVFFTTIEVAVLANDESEAQEAVTEMLRPFCIAHREPGDVGGIDWQYRHKPTHPRADSGGWLSPKHTGLVVDPDTYKEGAAFLPPHDWPR